MLLPYFLLICLGLLSGTSAAFLGIGGSVLIVPLLPVLIGLSPLETIQMSLSLIFIMSIINTVSFLYQKMILWKFVYPIAFIGLIFSFLGSSFVGLMTGELIRLLLLIFLFLMLSLPWVLEKVTYLKTSKGLYIFSSLMGTCVGLTGLGGGFLMSPYLHESEQVPEKNVSPVVCVAMFFTTIFALFGQVRGSQFPFGQSDFWWKCYGMLLLPSIVGLFIGYILNRKIINRKIRRYLLRSLVAIMFLKVGLEILLS